MKKVITFCLWGNEPRYNIGTIKNSKLALEYYPDFECWIYIHKETVPQSTIEELIKLKNVKIIIKTGDLSKNKPMTWRFEAIDNDEVEIMMARDTDTRFLLREKLAVDEWLNSNQIFHIMRDHPHHGFEILGGMFGTRKIPEIKSWCDLLNKLVQNGDRYYDTNFLTNIIYPCVSKNAMIHASFHGNEPQSKLFPIKYDNDFNFVGQYVYENDSRSDEHTQILKTNVIQCSRVDLFTF